MKWQQTDVEKWFHEQKVQRSFQDDVVSKILGFKSRYEIRQYGALTQDPDRYPLF